MHRAAERLRSPGWAVCRQVGFGPRPAKLFAPVLDVLGEDFARAVAALPASIIGILEGKLREWRRHTSGVSLVECRQFRQKDAIQRHSVEDNVAESQIETILSVVETNQPWSKERDMAEIKRNSG